MNAIRLLLVLFFVFIQSAHGQAVKIMPFGSWTEGLEGHVSYRYDLWFNLIDAGFDVDFVGRKSNIGSGIPDPDLYPEYLTDFDRDHQGYGAAFAGAMVEVVKDASATYKPDIVLAWVGAYDIWQRGAGAVVNVNLAIRDTIEGIRSEVPGVTILLGLTHQVLVLDSVDVADLNGAIAVIASELDTPQSPIIVVDLVTGFDSGSMLLADGIHHNRAGEAWVANKWFEVLANTIPDSEFQMNAGLNDAWYNPATDGQGFFITVFPDLDVVLLAWFTYDTELPVDEATANLGDPGHRWLLAVGQIEGNQAIMEVEMTSGGLFDTATDIERTDPPGSDGTITLTFDGCNSGTVEYDIKSINQQRTVPIQRVAKDNIVLCEALKAE